MASPLDAHSATSGGAAAAAKPDVENFFDQFDLNDGDFEDVEIDEEDLEIQESVRCLALARVHAEKNFGQSAFYKDMRAAWNTTQGVRFWSVGPNRFVVKASCLGIGNASLHSQATRPILQGEYRVKTLEGCWGDLGDASEWQHPR
ncbi:hypothetical protein D1007_24357 [Hordeum vulgare]|nr:hypothetical protein D1007_24357 [Hordeum vulgare]